MDGKRETGKGDQKESQGKRQRERALGVGEAEIREDKKKEWGNFGDRSVGPLYLLGCGLRR